MAASSRASSVRDDVERRLAHIETNMVTREVFDARQELQDQNINTIAGDVRAIRGNFSRLLWLVGTQAVVVTGAVVTAFLVRSLG